MRIENKEEFEFGEVFSFAGEGEEVEFEIGFWNKGEKGKGRARRGEDRGARGRMRRRGSWREKGKGRARREETEEMGATRRRSRREQWKDMLLFLKSFYRISVRS